MVVFGPVQAGVDKNWRFSIWDARSNALSEFAK